MRKLFHILLPVALLGAGASLSAAAKDKEGAVVHLHEEPLRIQTAHGTRDFKVEVAATPEEQERGLMFRREIPRHGGMIFPMNPPREATFWMKNTLVPLDLIFIRSDGTIARIAANAVPYSLNIIDSGEPVSAVLELAGGEAAREGITESAHVRWSGLNVAH